MILSIIIILRTKPYILLLHNNTKIYYNIFIYYLRNILLIITSFAIIS